LNSKISTTPAVQETSMARELEKKKKKKKKKKKL
jgi:hypothetical protein